MKLITAWACVCVLALAGCETLTTAREEGNAHGDSVMTAKPLEDSASRADSATAGSNPALQSQGGTNAQGVPARPRTTTAQNSEATSRYALIPDTLTLQPIQPIASPTGAFDDGVVELYTPTDLWDRIRRGFAMPDLQGSLVEEKQQWYSQRPEMLERMVDRSSKYLFHIVEELERRNMPTELALLPYIESAFNPQAISSAKAAGMWQFMPATGSYYDLKQNLFRDDRKDVMASTRAALDYLQRLYDMFGDWHLALAAYNWGEGSVSRAIAKHPKSEGKSVRYEDLKMPNETRHYVPKLQAVKNIIADPTKFKIDLPVVANHPYFDVVEIPRDIDVALAARLADVRMEDFMDLNPSMRRPVILAAGTPQILLPWDKAAVFKRNLQAYQSGQLASWTAWTAPDTLSVSMVATRVGTTEDELRRINNIPPNMLIKKGSTLLVPRSEKHQLDVTSTIADTAQLSLLPEAITRRVTLTTSPKDTLSSIAKRYQLTPAQVAQWNDLKPSAQLKSGQRIVLYVNAPPSSRSKVSKGSTSSRKSARKDSSASTQKSSKKTASSSGKKKTKK